MTEWTVAIGVATHKQVHLALTLDQVGAQVATCTVAATPVGYRRLLSWAMGLGSPVFDRDLESRPRPLQWVAAD